MISIAALGIWDGSFKWRIIEMTFAGRQARETVGNMSL
jgi:hypothetical protein